MRKRIVAGCLALVLWALAWPAMAMDREPMPEALYTGIAQTNIFIRTEQSRDASTVGHYTSGSKVSIIGYDPEWITVVKGTDREWVTGYVLRHTISDITQTAAARYPFGTTPAKYTADITKDVMLYSGPDSGSGTLFTLTEGTKVAILDIEDGWAKIIYWRQYAYFYLDAIENLTPVFEGDAANSGDTLAAFMSFFSLSEDGLNPNRIINITKASEYISLVLQPGQEFVFDDIAGPYRGPRGYLEGLSFYEGETVPSFGGGVCQVSSTLYNVLLALPEGIEVTYRRAHGPAGASYLPHGVDAAVGGDTLNLIFINRFSYPVRIETKVHDGALYIAMHKV